MLYPLSYGGPDLRLRRGTNKHEIEDLFSHERGHMDARDGALAAQQVRTEEHRTRSALARAFPPNEPTNEVIAQEWLTWLRDVRRRTPLTVYQYAGKLESFFEHIGATPLRSVEIEQMEAWLNRPRPGRGKGEPGQASTLQKEVAILKGLYRFAQARGQIAEDPTQLLGAPTVHNENPKPIDDEVWTHLWNHDSLSPEARSVFGLGYFGGLRRFEIVNLLRKQVQIHRARLVGFTRKGGGDDVLDYGELANLYGDDLPHLIGGSPGTFLGAMEWHMLDGNTPLVFDWPVGSSTKHTRPPNTNDPQMIYRRMRKWFAAVGLPEDAFTPHQLRHSFVTNLLRADVPIHVVSRLANHSSIAITMRYAKVGGTDLRELRKKRAEKRELDKGNRF